MLTCTSWFSDPRDWTKRDLHNWLKYMQNAHNMEEIKLDRFLMNGKALCLMNAAMFSNRVPVGGKLLFRDFRTRLGKAMAADAAKMKAKMAGKGKHTHAHAHAQQKAKGPSTGTAGKTGSHSDPGSRVTSPGRSGATSPAKETGTEHRPIAHIPQRPISGVGKENVKPRSLSHSDCVSSTTSSHHDENSSPRQDTVTQVESSTQYSPPGRIMVASHVSVDYSHREGAVVERADSPILDVTTVDEEESPLGASSSSSSTVTCVA